MSSTTMTTTTPAKRTRKPNRPKEVIAAEKAAKAARKVERDAKKTAKAEAKAAKAEAKAAKAEAKAAKAEAKAMSHPNKDVEIGDNSPTFAVMSNVAEEMLNADCTYDSDTVVATPTGTVVAVPKSPEYYVTRISYKNKDAMADYQILENEIQKHTTALWDNDNGNRMKPGDYWCPIVGEKGQEMVHLFQVIKENHVQRPSHWQTQDPYNEGNGTGSVGHRHVILLEKVDERPVTWAKFKKQAQWSPDNDWWMPRGTTRPKHQPNNLFT